MVAQADFLAGLVEALVGGRLRRRISSEFDEQGQEYWVRQIAVGHENDPEVGWCLVQVPDFKSFDPIKSGILPEGTDPQSPEFFAAYDTLVYDFYAQHVGDILEMPKDEVKKIQMVYGPKLFTLIERMGTDARLAPNGVVAGDSFGNGHFLTSGGAMTGMVGHSWRVYEYFSARDAGVPAEQAIRTLADRIKEDTEQLAARERAGSTARPSRSTSARSVSRRSRRAAASLRTRGPRPSTRRADSASRSSRWTPPIGGASSCAMAGVLSATARAACHAPGAAQPTAAQKGARGSALSSSRPISSLAPCATSRACSAGRASRSAS